MGNVQESVVVGILLGQEAGIASRPELCFECEVRLLR